MDTTASKTPAPLPFAAWQAMAPAAAAREIHSRVATQPDKLRSAALAWLRPEAELAAELAQALGGPASRRAANGDATSALLHNIPYFLKDLFDVTGVPTKAGSTFLDKVRPTPGDSTIVQRLRETGAVFAGKTHLVEFASGLTGENPHYGDCPHPHFPARLSGGSSSGSAALVAAGVVPLAIGTDTGGSVRVPAAWCGLYGFRLTPGDPLIRDAFPLAPTMDTAGWFTANAGDMLTVWRAIAGEAHSTSKRLPRGCYLPGRSLLPSINPSVDAACEQAAAPFATRADAATEVALLSSWQNAVDAYVIIGMSEAHAVHRNWLAPFREHYDPIIWQRFTDAGHYSAEKIARARATLQQVRETWAQFFASYDFLVLPSVPTSAPTKTECTVALRRGILALTAPASLGGLPCLSLPVALASGLSAGLQIILPAANSQVVPWILQR
jgi:amidase/aspartyl-tRNA(Asn)/glutamyl-tRNA(Gln) amidotransferase subunit A